MAESSMSSEPTPYTPPGETFLEKAKRKTVEEPLVPMGMFLGIPHFKRLTITLLESILPDDSAKLFWNRNMVYLQTFV